MKYRCVKYASEIGNSRHRRGWYELDHIFGVRPCLTAILTKEEEKWNDENMELAYDNHDQANYGAAGMQRRCMQTRLSTALSSQVRCERLRCLREEIAVSVAF